MFAGAFERRRFVMGWERHARVGTNGVVAVADNGDNLRKDGERRHIEQRETVTFECASRSQVAWPRRGGPSSTWALMTNKLPFWDTRREQ